MTITIFCHRQRPQRGYSMIELLISLVLGMAVLVGLSTVFVTVKQTFRFQETTGRMQEDGAFALDSIAQNLRMAGYAGCVGIKNIGVDYFPASVLQSGNPDGIKGVNPLATIYPTTEVAKQPFTPSNFIRGFDSVPSGMFATGAVPVTGTTDSLFFAGGSAKVVGVTGLMSTSSAPLTLAADPYKWSTTNDGIYDMIVSNCDNSYIFKGKVITIGSPSMVSIDHSDSYNKYNEFKNVSISTATTVESGVEIKTETVKKTEIKFDNKATVMPAEWSFYYVATRSGAITPSLYRVFFDGNKRSEPEELVSNVESMRLHYGESTETTPLVIDAWRTCAVGPATPSCNPVVDWSRIVAVRIGLMMSSVQDNVNSGGVVLNVPTLLGLPYSIPSGASHNRLRKEFSTTVVLRNRVAW